jgi:hypothetical protein
VSVDDNGVCTVVLVSGDAFAYNQSLDCWVEIFNAIFTTSPLMSTATTNPGSLADVAREATRLNPFAATRAVSLSAEDQRIEQLSIIEVCWVFYIASWSERSLKLFISVCTESIVWCNHSSKPNRIFKLDAHVRAQTGRVCGGAQA